MENIIFFKRGLQKDKKRINKLAPAACTAALVLAVLPLSSCNVHYNDLDITYYEKDGSWFLPTCSLEPQFVDINSNYVNINHMPIERFNDMLEENEIVINDNGVDIVFDKNDFETANDIALEEYQTRKTMGMASQLIFAGLYLGLGIKYTRFCLRQQNVKQKIKEKLGI